MIKSIETKPMGPFGSDEITQLLNQLRGGDPSAESRLIQLVYPELRQMAARYLGRERREHTLQPTALVNEVYLRVVGHDKLQWSNRAHFFAVCAQLMRQILVDHARKHRAARRGSGGRRVELQEVLLISEENADVVLEVDRAITKLEELDPRQANIVVFRFFGGLTEEEIADVLGISARTVKRDWRMAKAWLHGILAQKHTEDNA